MVRGSWVMAPGSCLPYLKIEKRFKAYWFLGFLVSCFQSFLVSWFQSFSVSRFLVSKFLGFKVTWFQGSWFLGSKVPKFQSLKIPILPNFHVMSSGRYWFHIQDFQGFLNGPSWLFGARLLHFSFLLISQIWRLIIIILFEKDLRFFFG